MIIINSPRLSPVWAALSPGENENGDDDDDDHRDHDDKHDDDDTDGHLEMEVLGKKLALAEPAEATAEKYSINPF